MTHTLNTINKRHPSFSDFMRIDLWAHESEFMSSNDILAPLSVYYDLATRLMARFAASYRSAATIVWTPPMTWNTTLL